MKLSVVLTCGGMFLISLMDSFVFQINLLPFLLTGNAATSDFFPFQNFELNAKILPSYCMPTIAREIMARISLESC